VKQSISAVYENGVFRPLERPRLPDGQQVQLTVEMPIEAAGEDLLELAASVYEGLTNEVVTAVEEIALDRRGFFGDRTR